MTSTAIKEYESVKVCHLDLLKTSYDEWKVDFYNLIGASTPSLYYLLSSSDGLLLNRPSNFVDADAPTEVEKEALRVYDTRALVCSVCSYTMQVCMQVCMQSVCRVYAECMQTFRLCKVYAACTMQRICRRYAEYADTRIVFRKVVCSVCSQGSD